MYQEREKCLLFVIFSESQLSACTNHNNGSIWQERVKIFELWYRIYQAVLTKQRQESFVILSRELSESESESERAFSLFQ